METLDSAVNRAAFHLIAKHEETRAVTVVGSARAVLLHGAAELGHGGEHDVVLILPKVPPESCDGLGEVTGAPTKALFR